MSREVSKSLLTWESAEYCHESLFCLDAFRRELVVMNKEVTYLKENKLINEEKAKKMLLDLNQCIRFLRDMTGKDPIAKRVALRSKNVIIEKVKELNKDLYKENS